MGSGYEEPKVKRKARRSAQAREPEPVIEEQDDGQDEEERPRKKRRERVLFEDPRITVTTARVIVHESAMTYAMVNITSVGTFVERPGILAMLGLSFALIGSLLIKLSSEMAMWFIGAGVVLTIAYLAIKPKHWVRIGTAGAETNAVYSRDPKWSEAVVTAINDAIISRG